MKPSVAKPSLAIEWWPIDKPQPYGKNPRKPSPSAVRKVAASINEFGWRQPIVVDAKGVIVAGHKRMEAAKSLDLKSVPVHVASELTAAQCKAYRLMDNRSSEESDWDLDLLMEEMGDLSAMAADMDLTLTGFEQEEIDAYLAAEAGTEGLSPEDEAPAPPADPVSKLGDLWLLGKHRVMCGDATEVTAVERLMAGEKADMVFTDPPYGISIVRRDGKIGSGAAFRGRAGTGKIIPGKVYAAVLGDGNTDTALDAYRLCAAMNIPVLIFWGGNHYAAGLPSSPCWIVWDKRDGMTGNDFADCELAWTNQTSTVRMCSHRWSGLMKASERGEKRCHPTQKPAALAVWCFEKYGADAKSVLDLFGGSGSTLIACEKTARACRMMELAPAYVDVIVQRWQKFTGQSATLESDGRTFDAVATERAAPTQASPAARTRAASPRRK